MATAVEAPNRTRIAEPLLRAALPGDAAIASELIYLPMGRFADYLFGSDDPVRARQVFADLFVRRENRFSFEFSDVLELDGQVVGLLLSYPTTILRELAAPMGKQLREIIGLGGMFRLLRRSLPLMRLKEAEPDEYYIFTLAIRPEFQKHGLGKRLLGYAEEKAQVAGLSKCALGVTQDNHGARRFYQREGYEVVDTVAVPKLEQAIGYPGYYRMVKKLATA